MGSTKDCIIEIVVNDIFKVENFPERITLSTDIEQEMVQDYLYGYNI